jgi:5'(3')-deoxyribonucleotidase
MRQLKIMLDLDNSVSDFNGQFIYYASTLGYKLDTNIIYNEWTLEKALFELSTEEATRVVNYIMSLDDFWLTMKPFSHAIEYINWLALREDCYIVTSPWKMEDKYTNTKLLWVEKNIPLLKNKVLFTHEKWKLDMDVIIDDKPETLINCNNAGIVTIAIDYGYNKDIETDFRMNKNKWYNLPVYIKQVKNILTYKEEK